MAAPAGHTPIEKLHVGDQVLAENPKTGKVEPEPVLAVIHDPVSTLMAITLSDGSTLQVTPTHSFWVDRGAGFKGPGWLQAAHLAVGDQVRTTTGMEATIVGLRYHVGRAAVYTLTVAHDHTFWGESRLSSAAVGRRPIRVFVGSARVLVHNANCGAAVSLAADRAMALQRALPLGSQGRVTMAVGIAEDANGAEHILVGTSEPNGYLRAGVRAALQAGEQVVPGTGHAEGNIVRYAAQRGWKVIAVGAGRPVCTSCVTAIEGSGGIVATGKK